MFTLPVSIFQSRLSLSKKPAKLLVYSVSVLGLAIAASDSALAACSTIGTETVCTGTTTGPIYLSGDGQSVTVEENASIDSTARAIEVVGEDNQIENNGTIGSSGNAVVLQMRSTTGNLSLVNNGEIFSQNGISAAFLNTTGGDITFENTGDMGSAGLIALAGSNSGTANVTAINSGTITETRGFAALRGGSDIGNVFIDNSGIINGAGTAIEGVNTSGRIDIVNSGDVSGAFRVISVAGGAAIDIENAGSISGPSQNTSGIYVRAEYNAEVDIHNTGEISVGDSAINLNFIDGQSATVLNDGDILTSGDAISFLSNSTDNDAAIELTNSAGATIETTGRFGDGINIDNDGAGDIKIQNAGSILTSGDSAVGIRFLGANSDISIENSGQIQTTGFFSHGMNGNLRNADINIQNSGEIDVTGWGIVSSVIQGSNDISNTGSLNGAYGIYGDIEAGPLSIDNAGSIQTHGSYSGSISVGGFGIGSAGQIQVLNDGMIESGGAEQAPGIEINVWDDDASLIWDVRAENGASGEISTTGTDSSGIRALSYSNADISLVNAGTITTDADNSHGIQADFALGPPSRDALSSTLNIDNIGLIQTNGTNSSAIFLITPSDSSVVNLTNSGSLSGNETSIRADLAGSTFNLNSSGEINGDIVLRNSVDQIDLSGDVNGDIDLAELDDILIFSGDGSGIINGNLIGGSGYDRLEFASSGIFNFSESVSEFEQLIYSGQTRLSGADFAGAADAIITQSGVLQIAPGTSEIAVTNGIQNFGVLQLAPNAVLDISAGGFTNNSGSVLIFDLDTGAPEILVAGDALIQSDSQIEINVLDMDSLFHGRAFDAITASGSVVDLSPDLIDNSHLFFFTKDVVNGNVLQITAEQELMLDQVVNPEDQNALATASALQSIIDTRSAPGNSLATLFGQLPDDQSVRVGVAQFIPGDSGGIFEVANASLINVQSAFSDRLQGPSTSALDRNNRKNELQIWGDFLIADLKGDANNFLSAFSGTATGIAIGADYAFELDDMQSVIGGGIYNHNGDINDYSAAFTDSDLDGMGAIVYANLQANSINGYLMAGTGSLDASSERGNALTGEIAGSDYDGNQDHFLAGIEYMISNGNLIITPRAELAYISTAFDAYSEQSTIGTLNVSAQDHSLTRMKFEVDAAKRLEYSRGRYLTPQASIAVIDSDHKLDDLQVNFIDGGDAFAIAQADRSGTRLGVGTGITIGDMSKMVVRIAYRGEFGGGSDLHSGRIQVSFGF